MILFVINYFIFNFLG